MSERRRFDHWSARYIRDRVALYLRQKRHPDEPWLTRDAVKILSSLVRAEDRMLELGSGRSTLWFAARVAHVVSFEDDPKWYATVRERLAARGVTNVELFLKPRQQYVDDIAAFPDEHFDFALVDGVLRDDCTAAVLPKIKRAGFIVVDNSNWYLPGESVAPDSLHGRFGSPLWEELYTNRMKGWRHIVTSDGVTDTTFFFKP